MLDFSILGVAPAPADAAGPVAPKLPGADGDPATNPFLALVDLLSDLASAGPVDPSSVAGAMRPPIEGAPIVVLVDLLPTATEIPVSADHIPARDCTTDVIASVENDDASEDASLSPEGVAALTPVPTPPVPAVPEPIVASRGDFAELDAPQVAELSSNTERLSTPPTPQRQAPMTPDPDAAEERVGVVPDLERPGKAPATDAALPRPIDAATDSLDDMTAVLPLLRRGRDAMRMTSTSPRVANTEIPVVHATAGPLSTISHRLAGDREWKNVVVEAIRPAVTGSSSPGGSSSATLSSPVPAAAFSVPIATPSSVATTAPANAAPRTSPSEIVQAIRLQWAAGTGEAHIRLEPSHFGELTVAIRVEQGAVVVRLQSDTPAVREWLQANQQVLRQGLADHQLTLDRIEIAEPPSGELRDRRDDRPADERPRREQRRARQDGAFTTFEIEG